jgi:hypothetical protein
MIYSPYSPVTPTPTVQTANATAGGPVTDLFKTYVEPYLASAGGLVKGGGASNTTTTTGVGAASN